MVEVIVERWTDPEGRVDFRWSVWRDGLRVRMGRDGYETAEAAETDGEAFCLYVLDCEPERLTRL